VSFRLSDRMLPASLAGKPPGADEVRTAQLSNRIRRPQKS
jgi:hypothetical protein